MCPEKIRNTLNNQFCSKSENRQIEDIQKYNATNLPHNQYLSPELTVSRSCARIILISTQNVSFYSGHTVVLLLF